MANHYATLGLWRDASPDEVRSTYRRLAGLHHPDVGGDPARFLELQAAYDVLGDTASRLRYDLSLRRIEPEPEPEADSALPAVGGEPDRPSWQSLVAVGLGVAAIGLLVGGLVAGHVSSLSWRTLGLLRVSGFVLGVAAARVARSELGALKRLDELHRNGFGAIVDLPTPSVATRTAARCGWMLGRAAPVGFALLALAVAANMLQTAYDKFSQYAPLLQTLRSLHP